MWGCMTNKNYTSQEWKKYLEELKTKDKKKYRLIVYGGFIKDEEGNEIFVTPDRHGCLADYND